MLIPHITASIAGSTGKFLKQENDNKKKKHKTRFDSQSPARHLLHRWRRRRRVRTTTIKPPTFNRFCLCVFAMWFRTMPARLGPRIVTWFSAQYLMAGTRTASKCDQIRSTTRNTRGLATGKVAARCRCFSEHSREGVTQSSDDDTNWILELGILGTLFFLDFVTQLGVL